MDKLDRKGKVVGREQIMRNGKKIKQNKKAAASLRLQSSPK